MTCVLCLAFPESAADTCSYTRLYHIHMSGSHVDVPSGIPFLAVPATAVQPRKTVQSIYLFGTPLSTSDLHRPVNDGAVQPLSASVRARELGVSQSVRGFRRCEHFQPLLD